MAKILANGPRDRDPIPDQVFIKSQKMILDALCLIFSIVGY